MASKIFAGRRRDDVDTLSLERGDYKLNSKGEVWFKDPNGNIAHVTPAIWKITVHADRTITVSPSIYISKGEPNEWHGYLQRGQWRSV